MDELEALHLLAREMGVYTRYVDGLHRPVAVEPETLVRVCAALGAPISGTSDAGDALRARRASAGRGGLAPVLVAWDGLLPSIRCEREGSSTAALHLEGGEVVPLEVRGDEIVSGGPLPPGYHRLVVETSGRRLTSAVIATPVEAWRRHGFRHSWGVGTQLAALRSARSRSVGDLRDLEALCRWIGARGGDLVTVLPLLPTFNAAPAEPSPYSPVSRLFWSELILDLGEATRPTPAPFRLDVTRADAEVRSALAAAPVPEPQLVGAELARYARFRGAQVRLGRNWRDWPAEARAGRLSPEQVDPDEERFHLVAQTTARRQLHDLRQRLDGAGFRLGLDLAVGVHPDGYDPWSRQSLFAEGMSVGAPPDGGFPSGQDWGFPPVLPGASRLEGHQYLAASISHQLELCGFLRVDHIMALMRLYWIPHGFGLHEGTYVSYPSDELFAILVLESHRHHCEIAGENLGTVPPEIGEALPRHRIWGMYLAEFAASAPRVEPPGASDMALVGTHDTPTFDGWLTGIDIGERVRCGLLAEESVPAVREERKAATHRLAEVLEQSVDRPLPFLSALLDWLGRSESPLVVPWLEDFWLEPEGVNLPGTTSAARPNWQRPMGRLLDEVFENPGIEELVRVLDAARRRASPGPATRTGAPDPS